MLRKKVTTSLLALLLAGSTQAQTSLKQHAESPKSFQPNILRFTPLTIFTNDNFGVGLAYERIVDKEGKVGINIPLYLGLHNVDYYNGWGVDRSLSYALLFNPGIKFYPAGQRKVSYALGASLFTTMGKDNDYYEESFMKAGIMVNNYLHFNITPKFNFGMELGIGPSYLNQYTSGGQTYFNGIDVAAQFGFHMGYRF